MSSQSDVETELAALKARHAAPAGASRPARTAGEILQAEPETTEPSRRRARQ